MEVEEENFLDEEMGATEEKWCKRGNDTVGDDHTKGSDDGSAKIPGGSRVKERTTPI